MKKTTKRLILIIIIFSLIFIPRYSLADGYTWRNYYDDVIKNHQLIDPNNIPSVVASLKNETPSSLSSDDLTKFTDVLNKMIDFYTGKVNEDNGTGTYDEDVRTLRELNGVKDSIENTAGNNNTSTNTVSWRDYIGKSLPTDANEFENLVKSLEREDRTKLTGADLDNYKNLVNSCYNFANSNSNYYSGNLNSINSQINGTTSNSILDAFGSAIDGIVGILLYPAKLIPLLIGLIIQLILSIGQGKFIDTGILVTIPDILFNNLKITSIDFFSGNNDDSTISKISENIAIWYVSLRNLAVVLITIIAIYVGIRMAISTIAEDKAKYKQMLIDWVTSLALVFVMHYIIILIININNSIVSIFAAQQTQSNMENIETDLAKQALLTISFVQGTGNSIGFLMICGMTLIFFLMYVKRMITVAFLIIIAPLVTVTYSLDKMKDGKSQALDTWFKEFAYNVLIQPFHCIAYLALGSTAVSAMDSSNLQSVIVGIVILGFIIKSEDIVKTIFHFQSQSMASAVGHAAFVASMFGKTNEIANKAVGQVGKLASAKESKVKVDKNEKNGNVPQGENNNTNKGTKSKSTANNPTNKNTNLPKNNKNDKESTNNKDKNNKDYDDENDKEEIKRTSEGEKKTKSIGRRILKANALAASLMTGVGLGASSGTVEGAFAGLQTGAATGGQIAKVIEAKRVNSKLKDNLKNYTMGGVTPEEAYQKGIEMYNGEIEPDLNNSDEVNYYNSIMETKQNLKDNGYKDEELDKAMASTLHLATNTRVEEAIGKSIENQRTEQGKLDAEIVKQAKVGQEAINQVKGAQQEKIEKPEINNIIETNVTKNKEDLNVNVKAKTEINEKK